ncbi:MAG: potassium transporter TrkG [Pseudomonadota bacterium]
MRMRLVIAISAHVSLFIGLAMLLPLAFALYHREPEAMPLAVSMGFTIILAGIVSLVLRVPKEDLTRREGMMIVTMIWVLAGLFGALPYFFAKTFGPLSFESFVNCFFESVSGFTTTGASVLGATVPIESVGKGLLLWRSLTQWLGGMGIIALAVAILPILGIAGMQLFKAESAGHLQEKIRPRVRETAMVLWMVYIVLSVLEIVFLMLGNMSPYDAICHTFTSLSTGGFSTHNASIAAFNSLYIEVVIQIFMLLGATSFALHFMAWTRRGPRCYLRDSQFKFFIMVLIGTILFVSWRLFSTGAYATPGIALRYGSFQVVSLMTATGYATANYNIWPFGPQLMLLLCMLIGGCAGSTAGGIKHVRVLLMLKYAYREIERLLHTRIFAAVKMGGRVVHRNILESVMAFFFYYIAFFFVASLALSTLGMTLDESFYSVASSLGGVGPAIGRAGSMGNYFFMPLAAKGILIACMILGRLEIFTVLVLLTPGFWKK